MRLCIEFVIVPSNFDCCIYVLSHPGYPFPLASPPARQAVDMPKFAAGVASDWEDQPGPATGTGFRGKLWDRKGFGCFGCLVFKNYNGI